MDEKLRTFLDAVWEIKGWIRLHFYPDQRNQLVDLMYALYHREDEAGDGLTIEQTEFDQVHEDLAKEALRLPGRNDHLYITGKGDYSIDRQYRVYINASSGAARGVGRFIIGKWFESNGVEGFKMVKKVEDFDRFADPIVLYCGGENVAEGIANRLASEKSKLRIHGPSVHFARDIAPGIAIGQSPRDTDCSFDHLRALAIARALHCYFLEVADGQDRKPLLGNAVRESFDRFNINYEKAYLNAPGQEEKFYTKRDAMLKAPCNGRKKSPTGIRPGPSGIRATGFPDNVPKKAATKTPENYANKAATGRGPSGARGRGKRRGPKGSPSKGFGG